jgi:hypothetical protein
MAATARMLEITTFLKPIIVRAGVIGKS